MYTPTQLEAIKLFGRKDLEEWCIVYDSLIKEYVLVASDNTVLFDWQWFADIIEHTYYRDNSGRFEILWHVPHLEDLFRVAEEKGIDFWMEFWYTLRVSPKDWTYHEIKYNPTLPLIDQPSLPEIINLFK